MSQVLQRQWATLNRIPRAPSKIGTRELMDELCNEGFDVSLRSIQRDLNMLSTIFPDLQSDENPDAAGWYWKLGAEVMDFPAIDPPMALTFKLAEKFLSDLIPPDVMGLIRPYLDRADEVLSQVDNHGMDSWAEKVCIIPRTQPLIPAKIKPEVVNIVYQAVLNEKQLRGRYRRREGDEAEYVLHPLGLVYRNSVIYLVANLWDYQDPYHFALHRFTQCELLDSDLSIPEDFTLEEYVQEGAFQYAHGKDIKITLLFSDGVGFHLQETPLSEDQQISQKRDGRMQVTATVQDSNQLRWWILGFGGCVEVVRPKKFRKDIKNMIDLAMNLYD